MKRGDLVVFVSTAAGVLGNVAVAWGDPDEAAEAFLEVPNETRFEAGKVAVFLELHRYDGYDDGVAWVLVDGRRGWVWEHEICPLLVH